MQNGGSLTFEVHSVTVSYVLFACDQNSYLKGTFKSQ